MSAKPKKKANGTPAAAGEQPTTDLMLYQTEDGKTKIDVRLQDDTVWLSQKQMSELFQKDVRTVNEHIENLFEEKELAEDSVIRNFRITAADGKIYETMHYNLDVVISVAERVRRGWRFAVVSLLWITWSTCRARPAAISRGPGRSSPQ